MRSATSAFLLMPTFLLAAPACAHDTWLLAPAAAAPAESVRVALCTGELFPRSDHAADPQRIASWRISRAGKSEAITAFKTEGAELTAQAVFDEPGAYAIGVALHPRFIELDAARFDAYLVEENADAALRARRDGDAPGRPGREYYTKFAKTFVCVGEPPDRQPPPIFAHALELVPLVDVARLTAPQEMIVRVMLDGNPAPGLRIRAAVEGAAAHQFAAEATTNADGVGKIRLEEPGLWLIRTHVIRPMDSAASRPGRDGPPADWESFWASITLRVAEKKKTD